MTTMEQQLNQDAIEQAITGSRGPTLTAAELQEALRRLDAEGDLSVQDMADILGISYGLVAGWKNTGHVTRGRPGAEKPTAVLTALGPRPVGLTEPKATAQQRPAGVGEAKAVSEAVTKAITDGPPKETGFTVVDDIADLIEQGLASDMPAIRKLAGRARDTVEKLRAELAEDAEKAAARREVERLERELAEAKARLKGNKPASTTAQPAAAPVKSAHAAPFSNAEVREWARRNGIDVPERGIIRSDTVQKFRQATGR